MTCNFGWSWFFVFLLVFIYLAHCDYMNSEKHSPSVGLTETEKIEKSIKKIEVELKLIKLKIKLEKEIENNQEKKR